MKKSTVFALALVLALAGTAGASEITISSGLITWKAQDHESLLRISAPDGSVADLSFGPGEVPSFGLFDKAGDVIKDGHYNWELFLSPTAPVGVSSKLQALRAKGEDLGSAGVAPSAAKRLSGSFAVSSGDFVIPGATEDTARKDQVILDDLIVDGSACIGQDCVNGESFGFDTLRLKENNLRIKAQDTSNSASFPTNDWQITFNDSSNGGKNKFSIDDIDGGRTPFTIEASAPSHSLYVEDGGRIGFGTSTPVVELHVVDGDSPTLRLEQDGSSGFTPQTWDVAGNEAGFFVRDVTNGSTLPFRILPGTANNFFVISGDEEVGIGAGTNPAARFHIENTGGQDTDDFVVTSSGTVGLGTTAPGAGVSMEIVSASEPRIRLAGTNNWDFLSAAGGGFQISRTGSGVVELTLNANGNLQITGTITTAGSCSGGCDGVFQPDYELESIEEHAAAMWENNYLPAVGATPDESTTFNLSDMTTGMLNELEKAHIYIEQLNNTIKKLQGRLEKLEAEKGE